MKWQIRLLGISLAALSLIPCSLFSSAGTVQADTINGEYIHIKITSPSAGETITTDDFNITLAYDITWGTIYKQKTGLQTAWDVFAQIMFPDGRELYMPDKIGMINVPGTGTLSYNFGFNDDTPSGQYILNVWVGPSYITFHGDGRSEETSIKINFERPTYVVQITSPANGDTITSANLSVTISYKWEYESGTVEWRVTDRAKELKDWQTVGQPYDSGKIPISGKSGTLSLSTGISGQPAGDYRIDAWLNRPDGSFYRSASPSLLIIHYQPPTVAPGAIYIQSDPGDAEIWINFKQQVNTNYGPTPVGFTDLIPGKPYVVFIKKDGYLDYKETVTLAPNEIHDIKAKLQPGTTPTGWLKISSDPDGVQMFLNGKDIGTSPATFTDVTPGKYEITLKKDGYEDYNDTITIMAGKITEVNATMPPVSGGFPIAPVAGGAAAVAVAGGLIKLLAGRGKAALVKTAPQPAAADPYSDWWKNASPQARQNWDGFDTYMTGRYGPAQLSGYQDVKGNPSWSSAYQSFQKELKEGKTKGAFEDWVKSHEAGESQIKGMWQQQEKMADWRPQEIVDADKKYGESLKNIEVMKVLDKVREFASKDEKLIEFFNKANDSVVDSHGQVNTAKLNQLYDVLKHWKLEEMYQPQIPDYTFANAMWDTTYLAGRVALGAATGGYSEAVFCPISAVTGVRDRMVAGQSNWDAWVGGVTQGSFELVGGELMGRGIGYGAGRLAEAFPVLNKPLSQLWGKGPSFTPAAKSLKLAEANPKLAEDMNTFKKSVEGKDLSQYNRDLIIEDRQVVKVGKTQELALNQDEIKTMELLKQHGKEIANNAKLLPEEFKQTLASARQKLFENAQVAGTKNVINGMGESAEGQTFIGQHTGSHAQPGNPAYDGAASDFDHTVNFGEAKYNKMYEDGFNNYLKSQGFDNPKVLDMNVYGEGASNTGAYTGAGKDFVTHYNQTTGTDVMVQVKNGEITISRQTPQFNKSLLSNQTDVAGINKNFTESFTEKINKAGDFKGDAVKDVANVKQSLQKIAGNPDKLDAVLNQGAKEVSRTAGQHGGDSIKYFQGKGTVAGYEPPPAARVADLIKEHGLGVDDAMRQAGYGGSKQQLLDDFLNILGL